jgi:hypothetical protein
MERKTSHCSFVVPFNDEALLWFELTKPYFAKRRRIVKQGSADFFSRRVFCFPPRAKRLTNTRA